jgi:class 3 adenylate cyclase
MKLNSLLCQMAAVLALSQISLPAVAHDKDPFEKLDAINPEVLFKGIIREDDVTLLFKHLRESMAASARGEDPKTSDALNRRAEVIQREIAARGGVLLGVMLSAFEAAARQAVREGLSEFSGRP